MKSFNSNESPILSSQVTSEVPEALSPEEVEKARVLEDIKKLETIIHDAEQTQQTLQEAKTRGDKETERTSSLKLKDLITQGIALQAKMEGTNLYNLDPEALREENRSFIEETFEGWYAGSTVQRIDLVPIIIAPKDREWDKIKEDADVKKLGEYTLNPEMQGLDFESLKVFIPDLSKSMDKPLTEVAEHIISTYGDKYYIPGIEYWKWLIEKGNQAPQELKDGHYHFFFGSTLRTRDGFWGVPGSRWDGSEWERNMSRLKGSWNSTYSAVLLEK